MKAFKIPEATVMRLSVYSRFLEQADRHGIIIVSSGDIAEGVGVSPAQVRKDLAYFGEFGTRGVGYNVSSLYQQIRRILGLNREWLVVLVGAGKLGSALARYQGFLSRGFRIIGVFDNDPKQFGRKLNGTTIMPISQLDEVVQREGVEIGIITVPAGAAQEVADRLAAAGIKAILNFSPRVLNVPSRIVVRSVDFSVNLEVLTFNLGLNTNKGL